jgi:hypothetical protein
LDETAVPAATHFQTDLVGPAGPNVLSSGGSLNVSVETKAGGKLVTTDPAGADLILSVAFGIDLQKGATAGRLRGEKWVDVGSLGRPHHSPNFESDIGRVELHPIHLAVLKEHPNKLIRSGEIVIEHEHI